MEVLSIYIPTRNRSAYLNELLEQMFSQIQDHNLSNNDVQIYISDNASTDNTEAIANHFVAKFPDMIKYSRNLENVGVKNNVFNYYKVTKGEYCWIHADDELLEENALPYIINRIKQFRPHLFINSLKEYSMPINFPEFHSTYKEFLVCCVKMHPHIILAHTHLTINIFKKDSLDVNYAIEKADTSYGQMYGLLYGLKKNDGPVCLAGVSTIIVREKRADPDKETVEKKLYFDYENLEKHWKEYLRWIKTEFSLNELDVDDIIRFQKKGNYGNVKTRKLQKIIKTIMEKFKSA